VSEYSGIVADLDESIYHRLDELSSTEARMLLQSPAKYRYRKTNPPLMEPRDVFDVGSAIHAKVLGVGAPVRVLDYPDWRSKAAREDRDLARQSGETPVLQSQYEEIEHIAEAVLAEPTAREVLDRPGIREASIFAAVDEVPCRGRFDFLPDAGAGRRIAVDLKSTQDASPYQFTRSVAKFEYAIQRAWYLDALKAVTGEDGEMVFVAVEKEPPYLVAVHQLDPHWREIGHQKADLARDLYKQYVTADVWPNWPGDEGGVHVLSAPFWYVAEHEEAEGEIQ